MGEFFWNNKRAVHCSSGMLVQFFQKEVLKVAEKTFEIICCET